MLPRAPLSSAGISVRRNIFREMVFSGQDYRRRMYGMLLGISCLLCSLRMVRTWGMSDWKEVSAASFDEGHHLTG